MSIDVMKTASSGLEAGKKVALATITHVSGSAPGVSGAMMAVLEDGSQTGTVGGGKLEHDVLARIKDSFKTGESFNFEYDLGSDGALGMVCGGRVQGFVNILLPNRRLIIFGAGHVSQQIAALANFLPFDLTIVDEREELKSLFTVPHTFIAHSPREAVKLLRFDDAPFIVLVNRSHSVDYEALRLVVDKPASYIGMMGSRAKVADARARLVSEGVPADLIERIYMPIGLNICGGTPVQIAFSIVSELLAVQNGKSGGHRRI
ncbi:MAG: XdhC family protein [Defluviitaleaceae bacterium]|nr:XdhC family protein [Defluviitaleaceae bacterium]